MEILLLILGISAPILISLILNYIAKNNKLIKILVILQCLILFGSACLMLYLLYRAISLNNGDWNDLIKLEILRILAHFYGIFYLGFRSKKNNNKWVKMFFIILECLVLLGLFCFILDALHGVDGDAETLTMFIVPFFIQILRVLVILSVIKNKKMRKVILGLSILELIILVLLFFVFTLAGGFSSH